MTPRPISTLSYTVTLGCSTRAFAQHHALAHHAARPDAGRHADARSVAHHRVRSDRNQRAHLDVLAHHRRGMDAGLEFRRGIEAAHGARERRARLRHPDHRPVTRAGPLGGTMQAPRRRAFGLRRGLSAADERQFGSARRFQRAPRPSVPFRRRLQRSRPATPPIRELACAWGPQC
jgi:hypothetical protein